MSEVTLFSRLYALNVRHKKQALLEQGFALQCVLLLHRMSGLRMGYYPLRVRFLVIEVATIDWETLDVP